MKVYLDILLFVNMAADAAILWGSAVFLRTTVKPLRFFGALILSCAYGFAVVLPQLGFMLNICIRLAVSALIAGVAFGFYPLRGFLKKWFVFLLVSVTYVAVLLLVQNLFGLHNSLYIRNGAVYFNIPVRYILLGVAGLCIIQLIAGRITDKKAPAGHLCDCRVFLDGKSVSFKGLIDTGNFLREGISGLPVVLVDVSALQGIVPMDRAGRILHGEGSPMYTRYRLVPFHGAGEAGGLLDAFKPDRFVAGGREYRVIVAVSKKSVDSNGVYKGIIPVFTEN